MRDGIFGGWGSRYILTELRLLCWFNNADSLGPETGGGFALGKKIRPIEGAGAVISECTPEIRLRNTLYPYRDPLLSLTLMADLLLLLKIHPLNPADISLKQYWAGLEHLTNFLPNPPSCPCHCLVQPSEPSKLVEEFGTSI